MTARPPLGRCRWEAFPQRVGNVIALRFVRVKPHFHLLMMLEERAPDGTRLNEHHADTERPHFQVEHLGVALKRVLRGNVEALVRGGHTHQAHAPGNLMTARWGPAIQRLSNPSDAFQIELRRVALTENTASAAAMLNASGRKELLSLIGVYLFDGCAQRYRVDPDKEDLMDSTTLLVILIVLLLLGGGGYYGRGRWY